MPEPFRPRLLLAEAHDLLRNTVLRLVETDFEVECVASDRDSLVEMADRSRARVCLVDLAMLSRGVTVARLKGTVHGRKVVVVSVHDEQTVVERLLMAGADGFVVMRTLDSDLIRAIRKVLAGHVYVSPAARHDRD